MSSAKKSNPLKNKREQGRWAENKISEELEKKKYEIISTSYQSGYLEIDLIATVTEQTKNILCFIECKYRKVQSESDLSLAYASVPMSKQKKIIHAAKIFLNRHQQYQQHFCRFDVALLLEFAPTKMNEAHLDEAHLNEPNLEIRYFENAFIAH